MMESTRFLEKTMPFQKGNCPPEDMVFGEFFIVNAYDTLAPRDIGVKFAVETIAQADAVGTHQPWAAHPKWLQPYKDFTAKYPELEQLHNQSSEWRYVTGQKTKK